MTSSVFDRHVARYDAWYDRNAAAFGAELAAVRGLLGTGRCLEVGVGTGRFAAALSVDVGVDPSARMLAKARARGVAVVQGVAEALPFADESFDVVLFVVTLCFLDDPARALAEARRVVRPGGGVVIGFLDAAAPPGRRFAADRADSPFYRDARLRSAAEIAALLRAAGLVAVDWRQAVFDADLGAAEPGAVKEGRGEGLFCVVRARRALQSEAKIA